ncbi:N-acylneuraminate cytidylyltransferase [Cohaesibacter sp. ES.047]|uniref:acylneuraminate cytidylyltransferase family protein n=1 Tax=Cohaesibacter sp. ES.047 TaxID=1798205 RepID=UPI000BB911F8|nr:acylneuraminate cytidylyltransferase family protein [Cohaesibacter sp. ES.047]SNY94283.1 N-acylneuraminate cytidylyltransferase [Cohaesibacter sp. ES.047]
MTNTSDKIVCIIPARGNSKGIENKNLVDLGGKPLLHWTIKAAKQSGVIDRIIVSTESEAIADSARSAGAEVPYMRPTDLSQDHVHSVHVVMDLANWLEREEGTRPDNVMMLLPTSPFRTPDNLREAVALFKQTQAPAVISTFDTGKYMTNLRYLEDGAIVPVDSSENVNAQRQGLKRLYAVNGSIYIARTDALLQAGSFHMPGAVGYEMHAINSIDINSKDDLSYARFLQKHLDVWGKFEA